MSLWVKGNGPLLQGSVVLGRRFDVHEGKMGMNQPVAFCLCYILVLASICVTYG